MDVISKRSLFAKAAKHPDATVAIQDWFDAASAAEWRNLDAVRQTYPATDMVGMLAIFNIKGNRYRLIVRMAFQYRRVYIKEFLTHANTPKEHGKNGYANRSRLRQTSLPGPAPRD